MANKEHPRYAETEWEDWEFREFPMMVYPTATDQKKPYDANGKPLPGVIVNSDEELRQVMGFDEPEAEAEAPKAPAARKKPETVDAGGGVSRLKTEADEREEVIAALTTAGVQFDKSWSLARLQDALDTHNKTNEPV